MSATFAPRTLIPDTFLASAAIPHLLADARPGTTPDLGDRMRHLGLRDSPLFLPPLAPMEACSPTTLLHVSFRLDPRTSIGELYET